MSAASNFILPMIMALVGGAMLFFKKDLFADFVFGAREGIENAIKLLPTLIALLGAVYMFNASGSAQAITKILSPLSDKLGIPSEIVPLIVVRPMSGGASSAILSDILNQYGADSFIGRCVSVIAGSSDTILYVISVYFGAVGVKKTGWTFLISFFTMIFCTFTACLLCRLLF